MHQAILQTLAHIKHAILSKCCFSHQTQLCLLQPVDQGVIAAFKTYYLRCTFSQLIEANDEQQQLITNYWKNYNIMTAIRNIKEAWDEVTDQYLNCVW